MVFLLQPVCPVLQPVVGTFVEQLEQQKVKRAAVCSPVHKFEISSALGMRCWDAGDA